MVGKSSTTLCGVGSPSWEVMEVFGRGVKERIAIGSGHIKSLPIYNPLKIITARLSP